MYPEVFIKEPSKKTPWVILEPGRIFFMGRSIPENPGDFFRPIKDWIYAFAQSNNEPAKIEFGFEYINTSSTKWIFNILKDLAEMKDIDINASVTWYYENGDEDMSDLGFILRSLVECPFIVVEVPLMDMEYYESLLAE